MLAVTNADVAVTQPYQGQQTDDADLSVLDRARAILWLVIGADKPAMLVRLRDRDPSIPAGRIAQDHAVAYADAAAGVLYWDGSRKRPCAASSEMVRVDHERPGLR